MPKHFNVLFAISEADPLIKIGGLGDIGGTLPVALNRLSESETNGAIPDVRVVIPYHEEIKRKNWPTEWIRNYTIETRWGPRDVYLSKALNTDYPLYLIDGDPIRNTGIYSDNPWIDLNKYAFFSVAAVELARAIDFRPDVLHFHDWHTALGVKYLKQLRPVDPFFSKTRSLYTIHNLPYSGGDFPETLNYYGIRPAYDVRIPGWLRNLPMAIGLDAADRISTVSKTYAKEITTAEFGHGYESYLSEQGARLSGIVNGVMMDQWNPETDTRITVQYGADSLSQRDANKAQLQKDLYLPQREDVPLFVMVGRMSYQKGFDLVIQALRQMADVDFQAVILGTGKAAIENDCRSLGTMMPDRVRVEVRFDSLLSRRMYAGGDIFLMPSRYEPCGIAQMISMLYGCIPMAHSTGGLADTIKDPFDYPDEYTGFLYRNADVGGTEWALRRAVDYFRNHAEWEKLQRRAMTQDFSWRKQAIEYLNLYRSIK